MFELQWPKIGDMFIGAVYHPPKPLYKTELLLATTLKPQSKKSTEIFTAVGPFSPETCQLSGKEIVQRIGLMSIVYQPTRDTNILTAFMCHLMSTVLFVSWRRQFAATTAHAVVAYCHTDQRTLLKSRQQRVFRPITPNQHAQFLSHLSIDRC